MYTDDTSIPYRSDDIHKLQEAMNKDLTTVVKWLKGNKFLAQNVVIHSLKCLFRSISTTPTSCPLSRPLTLNSSKTAVMQIVKTNQNAKDADHIIVNNNEIIENVKDFVYLGTLITNNCNDTKEIFRRSCIASSAMASLTNIWKTKEYYCYYKEKAATHISF